MGQQHDAIFVSMLVGALDLNDTSPQQSQLMILSGVAPMGRRLYQNTGC